MKKHNNFKVRNRFVKTQFQQEMWTIALVGIIAVILFFTILFW